MKLLYNRQALEFIGKIGGIPLSAKDAEIYRSYLLAILGDLYERAYSEHDALAMQTHIFHDILKLLGDRVAVDRRLWGGARIILQRLAERDATAAATCGSLVALLCESDVPQVVDGALWVLSRVPQIDFPPVTTGVSVELKLLARLEDILQNSSTTERSEWVLQIVSNLKRDEIPNLRGPTINFHAASKPLMKLLYNRRALNFITNNRGKNTSPRQGGRGGNAAVARRYRGG
ncbi:hypothetical protein C8J57DRAFT_1241822 [Mycena rebaudengoi]|nr:hypothetical protein C8J57DRAFT_1241822 [Mycena rebaudengoi]